MRVGDGAKDVERKKERQQTLIAAVVESCWEARGEEEEKAAEGGVTDTEREEAD